MPFNPKALNERTLKQFVDRLMQAHKDKPLPTAEQWPPKRSQIQEQIAAVLGFPSWHQAIHAVSGNNTVEEVIATPHGQPHYPFEPLRWTKKDLDQLLTWASLQGATDITLMSNEQVMMEAHGKPYRVNRRTLTTVEILSLIESLLDGTMEHRGNCIDFAYSIKGKQNQSSLRFRVNATTFTQVGAAGWQMTLRCLPGLPPDFSQFNLDPEVAHTMLGSKQGLILVTGATGSGKSTLISSILRQSLETKENRVVYTFEDPIEYVYDEVETKGINRVIQQDPKQMGESYSQSIFRAMKRRPTEIFIGEARDKETIEQAINAALSGHLTYSTVFGNGCADVVKRMLNVFDVEDRNSYMVDLISTLRIVVGMKRVEGERGVRVALFETLIMDDDLVDRLIEGGLEHLSLNINQTLKSRGMDFVADAERKRNAGLISERTFKHLQRQYTS